MRLYYADSYLRQFRARVIESLESGGRPAAVLDQTAFYPTSGGQPHDVGRLGNARVLDVAVREPDQAVLHLLDVRLEPGLTVEGEIDWPRRFDHMQQHTGQHILSQAFVRTAGADTIGFHLGAESVSIDLATPSLPDRLVSEAESLANEVVTGNLPVRAWFPDEAELAALPLRKRPEVAGPVRIVAIGDFDHSACGGTHVGRTGEIGLIAVLRTERLKRGTRVEFLAGHRARADYARKHALLRELSVSLTCALDELPASVARLRDALTESRRQLAAYRERDLDAEAAALRSGAAVRGDRLLLSVGWVNRPVEDVRALALRITESPGAVVLFGVAGERGQLVFARAENLALDLAPWFRRALDALGGGRGGGGRILQGTTTGPVDQERLESVLGELASELARARA